MNTNSICIYLKNSFSFPGLGICITYVPAVVMVGFYFERRRPVASGLSVAGIGVGGLIYPPLIQLLIDVYTWRGTMFILAGMALNMCVFAMLLRPLKWQTMQRPKLLDLDLITSCTFVTFALAEILWNIGSLVLLTIAPHFSMLNGISGGKSAFLLSLIGVGSIVGRVFYGFIPCRVDNLTMLTSANYISGLSMVLYPISAQYWISVLLCLIYGVCFGVQLVALPIVTVELFGLKRLTAAYGYLSMADGLGALMGPFFAGKYIFYINSHNLHITRSP